MTKCTEPRCRTGNGPQYAGRGSFKARTTTDDPGVQACLNEPGNVPRVAGGTDYRGQWQDSEGMGLWTDHWLARSVIYMINEPGRMPFNNSVGGPPPLPYSSIRTAERRALLGFHSTRRVFCERAVEWNAKVRESTGPHSYWHMKRQLAPGGPGRVANCGGGIGA